MYNICKHKYKFYITSNIFVMLNFLIIYFIYVHIIREITIIK